MLILRGAHGVAVFSLFLRLHTSSIIGHKKRKSKSSVITDGSTRSKRGKIKYGSGDED